MKYHADLWCSDCRSRPLRFVSGGPSAGRQWTKYSRFRRADGFLGKAYAERDAASFSTRGIAPLRSCPRPDARSLSKGNWKQDHRTVAASSLYRLRPLVSIASRACHGSQESRTRAEERGGVSTYHGRRGNLESTACDYCGRNRAVCLAPQRVPANSVRFGFA